MVLSVFIYRPIVGRKKSIMTINTTVSCAVYTNKNNQEYCVLRAGNAKLKGNVFNGLWCREKIKDAKAALDFNSDSLMADLLLEKLANMVVGYNPKADPMRIVPPTCDVAFGHQLTEIEEEEEEEESWCQREFDQVLVDSGSVGDVFKPFHGRDIELLTVDTENRIAKQYEELDNMMEEFKSAHYKTWGTKKKDLGNGTWTHVADRTFLPSWHAKNDMRKGKDKRAAIESMERQYDSLFVEQDESTDAPSTGQAMYNFLEMYIDTMTPAQLAVAMDVIEDMKPNRLAKALGDTSDKLSWYYYTQCGLAVCWRLHRLAPKGGWGDTLNRLKENNKVNHVKTAGYDDRFYGEMSFDMEGAIDTIRTARDHSSRFGCEVQEAYTASLLATETEDTMWTPTLEEISDDPNDYEAAQAAYME